MFAIGASYTLFFQPDNREGCTTKVSIDRTIPVEKADTV